MKNKSTHNGICGIFQPVSSFSTTSPSSYKPRTSNTSYQTGVSPSRVQRSKSPLRSTSPVRRPVSPNMHRTTSPRLHNSSLSPTNKQVSLLLSNVSNMVGALSGFSSMLGVLLLPGWNAIPSKGYPQHQIH